MIVKDEERFLEQCLRSAAGIVDEINIVDTGSTDRTVEIARAFGARIEHREWRDDFAWARNESLAMATKRWVLQLDADEELLPESLEALEQLKATPAYLVGVYVRCINKSDRYGGGAMSHATSRIFPNHERVRYTGLIHEFACLDGNAKGIAAVLSPVKILHHGYTSDIIESRDKNARNLRILEEAIRREPDEAFHWYNYGLTTFLVGDTDRAIEAMERMWELTRDDARAFVPNGLQILADAYTERLGQPERGLEYALLALKLSPNYANAHFSAGKAHMHMKQWDRSREMYMAAIDDAAQPVQQFIVDDEISRWKAHSEIGATYALEGREEEAIEWFSKGLANHPASQPLLLNRGRALERAGRIEAAEADFHAAYAALKDEQAIVHLVNFLLRHGKAAQAVEIIERDVELAGEETAVNMLLAAASVAQQCGWHDGERYLLAALERAPGSSELLNPLEAIYTQRGDAQCIERLRAAEALTEPKSPADHLRRSHFLMAQKNYEAAFAMALSGIDKMPYDGPLRYNAALALVNLGKKDEALVHLQAIDNSNKPAHLQGKYLIAVIVREMGRLQEALAASEAILAEEPQQFDAALLRGSLLEQLGRSAEAETALLALMPQNNQRVAVELAGLYLRSGRVADAQRIATQALA